VALITRTIIFLLSLLFIIVLLGATTSFSDEFSKDVTKDSHQMYTIEWIHEKDGEDKTVTCGAKVVTYDYSARRFVFDHYAVLLDNGNIVSRFRMDALQLSLEDADQMEFNDFAIKIYSGSISKDGKQIFGGPRENESKLKGLRVQFKTFNNEDVRDIITLYKGGYDLNVYILPHRSIRIPIVENPLYAPEKEKTLLSCIDDLKKNKEYRDSHGGEIFPEQSQNVG
jgi:hypothetical protein